MNQGAVIPVKVFVRARPFNDRENAERSAPCVTFYKENNQIEITKKMFAFDSVMDPSTSQKTAFEITTNSLIEKIMKGFNCTVLAYGQTGSGKTYTMGTEETTDSMTRESRGIIPRLVEQIFGEIKKAECPSAYQVYVSMLEIYDEKVNDLLSSAKDLQVREINGMVTVQGLTRNIVKDLPATMRQLETGCSLRSSGETAMNAKSSRSHAIFTISIDKTAMSDIDTAFKAKLHLVDLAGSERLKKTQAEGERMKEGIRINEGLLALGNVISALSDSNGTKHIPYRDSKITRLLQGSLGGNSFTVMIACISPTESNAEETLSTLRYADRAKKIKNKPVVNEDVSQICLNKMLKQLQERVRQLEKELVERGDDMEKRRLQQELDIYKQELVCAKKEQEKAIFEDTMAFCNSSPQSSFKTPAAKRERRKTRWGNQFTVEEENKENREESVRQLKEIINLQDEKAAKLKYENDSYKSDLDSRQAEIDNLKRIIREIENEKSNLQADLEQNRDKLHTLEAQLNDLQQLVTFKDNEILVIKSKFENFKTEKSKRIDAERKLEELTRVSKSFMVDLEKERKEKSIYMKENMSYKDKLDEHEHHIGLLTEQLNQLTKVNDNERSTRRALRETAKQKEELEKELFEVNEKYCSAETQVNILTGNIQQKEEEIASLAKLNDELQFQLSGMTGHSNKNQKIKLMEKYTKENSNLRTEKAKLNAELDRYKREFGNLKN